MKTSIYLLSILLIPGICSAYEYERSFYRVQVTESASGGESGGDSLVVNEKVDGPFGYKFHYFKTTQPWGTGKVLITTAIPQTSFKQLQTDENKHGLTFKFSYPAVETRWDLMTGDRLLHTPSLDWPYASGTTLEGRVDCLLPEKIKNTEMDAYGLNPSFTTVLTMQHYDTNEKLQYDITCSATYMPVATLSMRLEKDKIALAGPAGTAQYGTNHILLTTDPGKVRLTISNRYKTELRVSFAKENETVQTEIRPTTSGDISIPFYVTTLDTAPGVREYAVNINATFI